MTAEAPGLEIETDRAFQERLWTLQRVSWIVMTLLLIAAVLGLTGGGGMLAHGTARGESVTVDYPRITRWQAADTMTVEVENRTGPFEITLDKRFGELFAIERTNPQASATAAVPDGHRLTFNLGAEPGRRTITFELRARKPALPTKILIGFEGELPLTFRTIALP